MDCTKKNDADLCSVAAFASGGSHEEGEELGWGCCGVWQPQACQVQDRKATVLQRTSDKYTASVGFGCIVASFRGGGSLRGGSSREAFATQFQSRQYDGNLLRILSGLTPDLVTILLVCPSLTGRWRRHCFQWEPSLHAVVIPAGPQIATETLRGGTQSKL